MSSIRSVVLSEQKRLEILLDRGLHQVGALREGRAAVAVEPVLIGGDLDHGQAHALRLAFNHADVFDSRRRHCARCAGRLLLQHQQSAEPAIARPLLQGILRNPGVQYAW